MAWREKSGEEARPVAPQQSRPSGGGGGGWVDRSAPAQQPSSAPPAPGPESDYSAAVLSALRDIVRGVPIVGERASEAIASQLPSPDWQPQTAGERVAKTGVGMASALSRRPGTGPPDLQSAWGVMPEEHRTALKGGVRNTAALGAGIADLAAMGADYAVGDDEVTGLGAYDAARGAAEKVLGMPQGYEPTAPDERVLAGLAEAAGTFAVPGGLGFKSVRALPQAVKAAKAGKSALGAYKAAGTAGMGMNATRLGASNLAGSLASQYAQANFDPDNMVGQIGLPMAAAMIADPLSARTASMAGRQGTRAAKQAAARAMPGAKKGFRAKSINRLAGNLKGRVDAGDVTITDVIEARDHLHRMLFGQAEPIRAADIQKAVDLGNMDLAITLRGRKKAQDIFMARLAEAKELREAGLPRPTSRGWLGGLDDEVGGERLGHMAKDLGALDDDFSRRSVDANVMARRAYADEASKLSPRSAGMAVEGVPESVRSMFDEASAAAGEVASEPWSSRAMGEILDNAKPVPKSSVRRIVNNVVRDMDLSDVESDSIDADALIARLDEFADGGAVSARNFKSVLDEFDDALRTGNVPPKLAARKRAVYERMKQALKRRLPAEDRETFESANEAYRDFKRTYDPEMNRLDKRGMDRTRMLESRVAKALRDVPETADDTTRTVKELMKAPGTGEEIGAQIRKVMGDDPMRVAEVEQQVWRSILGPVVDMDSTPAQLKKAIRANAGAVDLEEQGKLISLYRSLAGDEKADAAQKLLTRGRQARYDDTGTMAKTFTTHSSTGAQLAAEEVLTQPVRTILRRVLEAATPGVVREDLMALAMKEALIDPAMLYDLMNIPSGAAFDEWSERIAGRVSRAAARESRSAASRAPKPKE